jgi:hypothetical protein
MGCADLVGGNLGEPVNRLLALWSLTHDSAARQGEHYKRHRDGGFTIGNQNRLRQIMLRPELITYR